MRGARSRRGTDDGWGPWTDDAGRAEPAAAPDRPAPDQPPPDGPVVARRVPVVDPLSDETPTEDTRIPTAAVRAAAAPTSRHRVLRRRYRRQRPWWRRRRPSVSSLLTTAAVLLAATGVTLIVLALGAQVHPPTPPPESGPGVPVAASPVPLLGSPAGGVPTSTGRTVAQLRLGDLLPTPDLLPHATPAVPRPRAAATPDEIRAARALAAVPSSPPTRIRVPSIGVDSVVDAVGLTPTGEMEVPAPGPAYDHAAWYRYSVTPGRQGPSVIIGHIDSRANGPSVFFELGRMRPGDRIEVTRADGVPVVFAVTDIRTVSKEAFPTAAVYGGTVGPELRLISCGGSFDDSERSYRDNIVVFARQLPAPPPAPPARPPAHRHRVPGVPYL